MYSRPSTSRIREPFADETNRGAPPTDDHARTGELTPPGITRRARANHISDVSPDLFMSLLGPCHIDERRPKISKLNSRYLATLEICETKLLQRTIRNTTQRASAHSRIEYV
jgi:hypothetical protein